MTFKIGYFSLYIARKFGRKIGLGVGSIRFMDVIHSDGPATIDRRDWNVSRGISSTTGHSNYVAFRD